MKALYLFFILLSCVSWNYINYSNSYDPEIDVSLLVVNNNDDEVLVAVETFDKSLSDSATIDGNSVKAFASQYNYSTITIIFADETTKTISLHSAYIPGTVYATNNNQAFFIPSKNQIKKIKRIS